MRKAFNILRKGMMRFYNVNLCRSFGRYLVQAYGSNWIQFRKKKISTRKSRRVSAAEKRQKESEKDLLVAREGLTRASLSAFMDWKAGSTIYFWRWPVEYQKKVQDGLEVYISGTLPSYWATQRFPVDFTKRQQMGQKLAKVCQSLA